MVIGSSGNLLVFRRYLIWENINLESHPDQKVTMSKYSLVPRTQRSHQSGIRCLLLYVMVTVGFVAPRIANAQSGTANEPVDSGNRFGLIEDDATAVSDQPDESATSSTPTTQSTPYSFVPPASPQTLLRPIIPRSVELPGDASLPLTNPDVVTPPLDGIDGSSMLQPYMPGRTDLRAMVEGSFDPILDPEPETGPEIIRQRYPDGKVQLMKQVAQDAEGNYFNHGDWKLFNRRGQILAEGRFSDGRMQGVWQRWHPAGSGGIFTTEPFNQFKGPFLSTANFTDGELNGDWKLTDHFEREIFTIPYRNGQRHGTATWWHPNGSKMREVVFVDGIIDGALREYDENNKLVRYDEFIEGKKIVRQTSFYRPKQKQDENFYLDGKLVMNGKDDWWEASPAAYQFTGTRTQHGPTFSWHNNGQPKMKGQYRNGLRLGQFTWWHSNGQKALQGAYNDEGSKVATWTWWHPNGIKSIQGNYTDDNPAGEWTWWDESGRVTNRENMDNRIPSDNNPNQSEDDSSQSSIVEEPANDSQQTGDSMPAGSNDQGSSESPGAEPPKESILIQPEDDFNALEEIQPYGEGSVEPLPEQSDESTDQNGETE